MALDIVKCCVAALLMCAYHSTLIKAAMEVCDGSDIFVDSAVTAVTVLGRNTKSNMLL